MVLATSLSILLAAATMAGLLHLRRTRKPAPRPDDPDDLPQAVPPTAPVPPLPAVAAAAGVATTPALVAAAPQPVAGARPVAAAPQPVAVTWGEPVAVPVATTAPDRVQPAFARRAAANSAASRFGRPAASRSTARSN